MHIAESCVCLICCTDVPVQALIPLICVITLSDIFYQIAIGLASIGVRSWIHAQDVLSNRIDLPGAKYVCLSIAGKWLIDVGGIWLIELHYRTIQILIQQF